MSWCYMHLENKYIFQLKLFTIDELILKQSYVCVQFEKYKPHADNHNEQKCVGFVECRHRRTV